MTKCRAGFATGDKPNGKNLGKVCDKILMHVFNN